MLQVKLTDNYAGVTISGDFNDLNYLYNSINCFLKEKPSSGGEDSMQLHSYGFLYDLRHAYQGDREYTLVDNNLSESKRKWFGIKKSAVTENNVYYSFNYILPELIVDAILINSFVNNMSKKDIDKYTAELNFVNYFYSLVIDSLHEFLSNAKINEIKKGLHNTIISSKTFIPQWYEDIAIDYMKMTKERRKKEFMSIVDKIYNYYNYGSYSMMKKALNKYCKENNCSLYDVELKDYPEEVIW